MLLVLFWIHRTATLKQRCRQCCFHQRVLMIVYCKDKLRPFHCALRNLIRCYRHSHTIKIFVLGLNVEYRFIIRVFVFKSIDILPIQQFDFRIRYRKTICCIRLCCRQSWLWFCIGLITFRRKNNQKYNQHNGGDHEKEQFCFVVVPDPSVPGSAMAVSKPVSSALSFASFSSRREYERTGFFGLSFICTHQ